MKVSGNIVKYAHGKYRVYMYLGMYDSEFEAVEIVDRVKSNLENGRLLTDIEPEKYSFKWYQLQSQLKTEKQQASITSKSLN